MRLNNFKIKNLPINKKISDIGMDLKEEAFSNFKYEETFIFVITNKNITKLKWN